MGKCMCGALRNYFYYKAFFPSHVVDHNHVRIWRLSFKETFVLIGEKGGGEDNTASFLF